MKRAFIVLVLLLTGCPPPDPEPTPSPDFLKDMREQPLTPADAALLHIIESNRFGSDQKVEAAKLLADLEKARVAAQSRELNRRVLELEREPRKQ